MWCHGQYAGEGRGVEIVDVNTNKRVGAYVCVCVGLSQCAGSATETAMWLVPLCLCVCVMHDETAFDYKRARAHGKMKRKILAETQRTVFCFMSKKNRG